MGRRPRVQRDEVLAAARRVFSERGYEGATLTAIAARLGLSPAALLRHEPTKEALFSAAMTSVETDLRLPVDALAQVAGSADPREVLRRVALEMVPFIDARFGESIVRWMRQAASASVTLSLPFDPASHPSPPQRALALITAYFRRARRAGRLRVRDPQAAALAFLAALHAYVFLHRVVQIAEPPIPLPLYVDTLLDVWAGGAFTAAPRASRKR